METGTYISGVGHLIVIGWAVLGGSFFSAREAEEFTVSDVSLISEAAFSALQSKAPNAESGLTPPLQPEIDEESPARPQSETQPDIAALATPHFQPSSRSRRTSS